MKQHKRRRGKFGLVLGGEDLNHAAKDKNWSPEGSNAWSGSLDMESGTEDFTKRTYGEGKPGLAGILSSRDPPRLIPGMAAKAEGMMKKGQFPLKPSIVLAKAHPQLVISLGSEGSTRDTTKVQLMAHTMAKATKLVKPLILQLDKLIMNDANYKQCVYEFLKEEMGAHPTHADIKAWVDIAGEPAYEHVETCWNRALDTGCERGAGGCEREFQEMYTSAVRAEKNIIYETSRQNNYPGEIIDKALTNPDTGYDQPYDVTVAYQMGDFCELEGNMDSRNAKQVDEFMKDRNHNPAPRLADTRKIAVDGADLMDTMRQVIQCVGRKKSVDCPGQIDNVLLFENEDNLHLRVRLTGEKARFAENVGARQAFERAKDKALRLVMKFSPHECPGDQERQAHDNALAEKEEDIEDTGDEPQSKQLKELDEEEKHDEKMRKGPRASDSGSGDDDDKQEVSDSSTMGDLAFMTR